jgi:hypothetical protein
LRALKPRILRRVAYIAEAADFPWTTPGRYGAWRCEFEERNYLIIVEHNDFAQIVIGKPEALKFDSQLKKLGRDGRF